MTRKLKIHSLLLITGNSEKAREFRDLIDIKDLKFDHAPLNLPEIQSMSLEKIGKFKTEAALSASRSRLSGFDAVLTDDTGLSCQALNGLPGPMIKWFLDSLGVEGLFQLIKGKDMRAKASCLLSLGLIDSGEIILFRKDVEGELVSPRGDNGFGWDKIFMPEGHSLTYAEMSSEQKNLISHRTLAVRELRDGLI